MEHSTTQSRILRVIALLLLASVFMGCFATAFAENDVLVSSETTEAPAVSEMPGYTPSTKTELVESDRAVTGEDAPESAAPSEDSNDALTELQPDVDADDDAGNEDADIASDKIIDAEPVSQVVKGETEGLTVSAAISEEAGFPAGTTLSVSKITDSGACESAMQAVADGYRLAENNVLYFIPYDIGFYYEGSKVEPASGSVAVTMTFSEPLFADEMAAESDGGSKTTELSVAHIFADGTVEKIVPQIISDTEISFETESFSTIGPALVISDDRSSESSDIYVPVAPGDVENAESAATIEDAVALAADNAVIWLTDNVSMDMAFVDGKSLTVRSYNGNYVISKNGTSPNMFVLDDGASLTLENIIVDSTANTAGRTITAAGGSTLILGEGAVLKSNRSFGAISLDSSMLSVNGGTIRDNATTTDNGGAVYLKNGSEFTMASGKVSGNSAINGGAIYFDADNAPARLSVTGGIFADNAASTNGSVVCSNAANNVFDISGNAVFSGNSAGESGGICLDNQSGAASICSVSIRDGVRFDNNVALRGPCLFIVNNDGADINVDGVEFTKNHGQWGGALYNKCSGVKLRLKDSLFQDNIADQGGGVYWQNTQSHNELIIQGCTFNNNEAGTIGGALGGHFREGTHFAVKNCAFTNDKAIQSGGAVYGSFEDCDFTVDGSSFTGNRSGESGGAIYSSFKNCDFTIDGSRFVGNVSGESGGGFMVYIADTTVTVTGNSLFQNNSADVNAGAFSVRRNQKDRPGTVQLLSCNIIDNVCNADFSRYAESDLEPTKHYNTGGIYIGENIVCHMYDALVTGNYVESGYTGNMVGSGIGLCPNAEAYLLPSHGSMVYGNGDNNTMDILAVPYDPVIDHETPAKLYVSDVTPDGRDYNWTDLDNDEARTGMYDWTNIRNGISMAAALDSSYHGETTLDPVGFKANIDNAGIMTMAASGDDGYEVRIIGNYTRGATYAAGGIMVNGTIFSGEFDISVEKRVEYPKNIPAATLNEILSTPFSFRLTITDNQSEDSWGYQSSLRTVDVYNVADDGTTKPFDAQIVLDANNRVSLVCKFTLKADEKINLRFIQRGGSYNTGENSYTIELQETDPGGADNTVIEYSAFDEYGADITDSLNCSGSVLGHMDFVCTNTFIPLILPRTGSVGPASLFIFSLLTCISGAAVVTVAGRHKMRDHAHPVSSSNKQNKKV